MKLSVVIPARNEAACIVPTLRALAAALNQRAIPYEILVINDHSTDQTAALVQALARDIPAVKCLENTLAPGFGCAIRSGLSASSGEAIAVYMADNSDAPEDLIRFYDAMLTLGVDCVFGSRFIKGGKVIDYPWLKYVCNRLGNKMIQILFRLPYNDITNAFKLYHRRAIEGLGPFLSLHFNLTVELPLKAIIRGYSYTVLPNAWTNRKAGESKLKIKEMGSRYMFIVLYCLIEKWLSRGDYRQIQPH